MMVLTAFEKKIIKNKDTISDFSIFQGVLSHFWIEKTEKEESSNDSTEITVTFRY